MSTPPYLSLAVRLPLVVVPTQSVLRARLVLRAARVHVFNARVARVATVLVALLAWTRAVAFLLEMYNVLGINSSEVIDVF